MRWCKRRPRRRPVADEDGARRKNRNRREVALSPSLRFIQEHIKWLTFPYRYFSKYRCRFRMVPRESALLAISYGYISLGSFVRHSLERLLAPQVPWFVLCVWLQKAVREDMAWSKPIDFYVFSCGSLRKQHEI